MKRIIFLFVAMLAFGMQAFAQDFITLRNGDELDVNIKEISQNAVTYVKPSMPEGPVFTLSKSEIFMIVFRDGTKEVFDMMTSGDVEGFYSKNPDSIRRGMSYKQLKSLYDRHDYTLFDGDERYDPALMGLASFFIPGLGQAIEGELSRGLLYFLGTGGLTLASTLFMYNAPVIEDGLAVALLGTWAGIVALDICSIVDAVRIGKVKNMYFHDLRQLSCDVKLTPYVNLAYAGTPNMQPVTGLSMRVTF